MGVGNTANLVFLCYYTDLFRNVQNLNVSSENSRCYKHRRSYYSCAFFLPASCIISPLSEDWFAAELSYLNQTPLYHYDYRVGPWSIFPLFHYLSFVLN